MLRELEHYMRYHRKISKYGCFFYIYIIYTNVSDLTNCRELLFCKLKMESRN